jgi:biopolymer transport protein ExbB/TolQ
MELDLAHMWAQMNPIVKTVVVVLTVQGLWAVTVTIDRLLMLFMSKRRSKKFAAEVAAPMQKGDAMGAMKVAEEASKNSHLARFIYKGIKTFEDNLALGMSRDRAAGFTKRELERTGENLSLSLNKGLAVLATNGSTSPFVGLLGTVFGILGAFKVIGQEGGGGLSTIGPLIGHALQLVERHDREVRSRARQRGQRARRPARGRRHWWRRVGQCGAPARHGGRSCGITRRRTS